MQFECVAIIKRIMIFVHNQLYNDLRIDDILKIG